MHFNVDAYRKDLKGVNRNSSPSPDGPVFVDCLRHDFKREFITIADRHAPLTQRRVRSIDNCPWLNKSIKVTMHQRDYFHKKAIKRNTSEDWANYRHYSQSCEIRSAKASYNKRSSKKVVVVTNRFKFGGR